MTYTPEQIEAAKAWLALTPDVAQGCLIWAEARAQRTSAVCYAATILAAALSQAEQERDETPSVLREAMDSNAIEGMDVRHAVELLVSKRDNARGAEDHWKEECDALRAEVEQLKGTRSWLMGFSGRMLRERNIARRNTDELRAENAALKETVRLAYLHALDNEETYPVKPRLSTDQQHQLGRLLAQYGCQPTAQAEGGAEDHPDCRHRCQYSLETGEFPFPRTCPQGECQRVINASSPNIGDDRHRRREAP